MYQKTIIRPDTKRKVHLKTWKIEPRTILDFLKDKDKSARDISWLLLNDDQSIQVIENQDGDQASNNFALAIFEQALDWRLGLAVIAIIRSTLKEFGKLPKPFEIGVTRSGTIFAILHTGTVIKL